MAVWRPPKLTWIFLVAVLARLAMLFTPVTLSSDVHRYLWEGKVQRAGHNPYRLAPAAGELAALRDANWERVEHREVPSAYPPLLLLVFRAGTTPLAFKLLFTAFDLATLWLLVKLAGNRVVIWAWNPLVVLEFAGNAHSMSLALAAFVAGLRLLELQRNCYNHNKNVVVPAAGAMLAVAALAHVLAWPAVLAATLAARVKSWRFWAGFVLVTMAGFAVFADAGTGMVTGVMNFGARWRFNGSLFEVLRWLWPQARQRELAGGVWLADEMAKRVAAGLLLAVFVWTWRRRYGPARAALSVTGAVILLSPAVHPWYVTWMVALCCVEFRLSWLVLSAGMVISYAARVTELATGVWADNVVVRWLEYAPFFVLWLVDSLRHRR